jgi:hypothetical protein
MVDAKCSVCTHVFADERPVLYLCREAGDQILARGGDEADRAPQGFALTPHVVRVELTPDLGWNGERRLPRYGAG